MGETVFVVGSNSFSGAHFVDFALLKGMDVIGISRSDQADNVFLPYTWPSEKQRGNFSFFKMDINYDLDAIMTLIQDLKPEYIVNFSAQSMVAQSWESPGDWFRTNTLSTILLHDRLRHCDFLKKYIHVSTPEVYGNCEGLIKEHVNYAPSTPYAVSRAAADMSLMTFYQNYQFPVVFTRAANVYGPGQQLYRIIPRAVLFFLTGKTLELHGGGVSVRSFIHIRDVAEGTFRAMLQADPGEIFHLSTRENLSIRELVERIADLLGVSFEAHVKIVGERPGKDAAYLLDSVNARQKLGWVDSIQLDSGIRETIQWVEKNLDRLLKLPIDYQHKP